MNPTHKKAAWVILAVTTIGGFEGYRSTAYRDSVGIPTVCFGETRGVHMGDKYTKQQCDEMLGDGIMEFDAGVMKCLRVPVSDKRHVAIVSFAYNVGTRAFCQSGFARRLNDNDPGACNELMKWNKAGGHVLPGLTRRRFEEKELCEA